MKIRENMKEITRRYKNKNRKVHHRTGLLVRIYRIFENYKEFNENE